MDIKRLRNAYNDFVENGHKFTDFDLGRHVGYYESFLYHFKALELDESENIVRKMFPKKWYQRKPKRETLIESIVRQVEKFLNENK